MKILEVPENKKQELTEQGIVICTYKAEDGSYVDGIDYGLKQQYPDFSEINVIEYTNII